ncbi:MAG: GNAT family N-acetyltransferase, partial [Phycisphaerales bacterium]|nr:GNAT family N-acetyltransferase [Phycisphaerales bacterium]
MTVVIVEAHREPELATAKALFREYSVAIADVAACSLQYQRFEEELATLPGKYASPEGAIYMARETDPDGRSGEALGCVALRPLPHLGERVCELKRMYVVSAGRGRGIGRLLAERVIEHARRAGYRVMKLDTSTTMTAAIGLYRSLGFEPCAAYNEDPAADTLWFELELGRRQYRKSHRGPRSVSILHNMYYRTFDRSRSEPGFCASTAKPRVDQ